MHKIRAKNCSSWRYKIRVTRNVTVVRVYTLPNDYRSVLLNAKDYKHTRHCGIRYGTWDWIGTGILKRPVMNGLKCRIPAMQ